jgi:hypothetical protein
MRTLLLFLKFPVCILVLFLASFKIKFKKKINEKDYQSLLNAFLVTGGWSNTLFSIINKNNKKIKIDSLEINKNSKIISNEINENGFYICRNYLSENIVNKLVNFAENNLGNYAMDDLPIESTKEMMFDRKNPQATTFLFNENLLLNNVLIQNIISDPLIISISQNYFKSQPMLAALNMWWSTNFKKEPDKYAAQMYHFDLDGTKWLKYFIYLTDVNSLNGPHIFIKKSHKNNGIPWRFRKRGYERISDQEIHQYFSSDKICEFFGKKGDLIIEDSRGYHKGKPVVENDRLILEIQFTDTLLFKKTKHPTLNSYNKNFEDLIKKNKNFFNFINIK